MGKTNVKVFSTRNGSQIESHLLDNVFEQLEEVLYKKVELFQPTSALGINVTPFGHHQVTPTLCKSLPTSPTLSKSSPAPRTLFDIDTERAMDKLDTMERHVNLEPMVLEIPPLGLAGPRTWRGTSPPTCLDSHAEVATIKPWSPGQQALSALSIDRSPSSSSCTPPPSPPPRLLTRKCSNFQNIRSRVFDILRAKYLDVKAQYKLLKHEKEERDRFDLLKY